MSMILVETASELAGISRQAILKRLNKGTLKGKKGKYRWLVDEQDVLSIIPKKPTHKIQSRLTHGLSKDPTHISWSSMKSRCTNPGSGSYKHYGGRGITVCDRWLNSFDNFLKDMGLRPTGTTLDRYPDKNGNYEPGNCRWATWSEQMSNRRKWGTSK